MTIELLGGQTPVDVPCSDPLGATLAAVARMLGPWQLGLYGWPGTWQVPMDLGCSSDQAFLGALSSLDALRLAHAASTLRNQENSPVIQPLHGAWRSGESAAPEGRALFAAVRSLLQALWEHITTHGACPRDPSHFCYCLLYTSPSPRD